MKLFPVCTAFLSLYIASIVSGQDASDRKDPQWLLPLPQVQPDPEIPTSEQVLRYKWADDVSSHHQIETYLRRLAEAAPDRTKLVQYGSTYEGRSLNYLVISSPENLSRIDELQANNLRLADPRGVEAEEAANLIADSPAVIWLAYCVHGNEISPGDGALVTAYHLIADRRPETRELLEKLVVIIDPLQNPDGRDRFVNVFRETRGTFFQSYPMSNEHVERWPGGRSNHYWFDMNRDWFRQSQQETRAKVKAYLDWQPQIYVDAHEMGRNSTFYFPPPSDPKNPYLLPAQEKWFERLGQHQAGWFDEYGFGYMTREVYDAFYPGYGSEWPTLQGGMGVLWEQAGARGLVIDRDDDTTLRYSDGVRNHYISGIATLEFAAEHREELLQAFFNARKDAIVLGSEGDVTHYFIPTGQRPQRATKLARMLQRNGIEVRVLESDVAVDCWDIRDETSEGQRSFSAGTYHIPVTQPAARLLRSLMNRQTEMDDKFLRRQLERNQLRLRDEIYDVTAWSMPLAFDVTCFASGVDVDLESQIWNADNEPRIDPGRAKVAYLVPGTDGAIQAMSRWLQDGVRVHVADEGFRLGGRDYDAGTLIVKVAQNPADLHDRIVSACRDFGIRAHPTDTAYVEKGAHMGGNKVKWVKPPKVLVVVNQPTNYSSGHTWYLFDQGLNYPTTRVNGRQLGSVDLSKFNTIVLPDGRYGTESGFHESMAKKLSDWVSAGGTLITLRGGTQWATAENIGLLKNEVLKRKVEIPTKSNHGENEPKIQHEELTPDIVPGAFFRAEVFQPHWVTYGYQPRLDVFYTGRLVLAPTKVSAGRSLVTFAPQDRLLTSGFCWPESLELLAETPYVVYRASGAGHVIAFTDDPNFRAMYPSLQRLFINAAFFGAGH